METDEETAELQALLERMLRERSLREAEKLLTDHASFAELSGELIKDEQLPSVIVELLLQLVQAQDMNDDPGSEAILRYLESEWRRVPDAFHERAGTALRAFASHSRNSHAVFLACELLGKFLANTDALLSLEALLRSPSRATASFAVYGLGCLVRTAGDDRLLASARKLIATAADDSRLEVQAEAKALTQQQP